MKKSNLLVCLSLSLVCLLCQGAESVLELGEGVPSTLPLPFGYAARERNIFRVELRNGSYEPKQEMKLKIVGMKGTVKAFDIYQNEIKLPKIDGEGDEAWWQIPDNFFAMEFSDIPASLAASYTPTASVPTVPLQQPDIAAPKGIRQLPRKLVFEDQKAIIDTGVLRCHCAWDGGRLQVKELYSYDLDKQVLLKPEELRLILLRVHEKNYDIRDAQVQEVAPRDGGFRASLLFPEISVKAELAVWGDPDGELRMSLEVRNAGWETTGIITYFPVLEDLQLSDKPEDDFYLFPHMGGLISQLPCRRRGIYGHSYTLFQLLDVFSPQNGGGIYLRADDATGLYKNFAINKAGDATGRIEYTDWPLGGRIPVKHIYPKGLEAKQGTSLAIDYVERVCEPGKGFRYPDAALGGHVGDWRVAMQIYADWAHRVWKWQSGPTHMADVWYIQAGRGTAEPLYSAGLSYLDPRSNFAEINGYWTASEVGPWGSVVDEKTRWSFIDPVTGHRIITSNRGDYGNDGYNPQWGGLSTLRKFISDIKATGRHLILYTVPMIAMSSTKLAQEHCPAWNVRNPEWWAPKGHDRPDQPQDKSLVLLYGGYRMCMENPEYQDWVVENLTRLLKDTGADGVRLDEFGNSGYICLSNEHKHWEGYAYNHNSNLQAVSKMMRRLRESFDTFPEHKFLMTEFVGNDMFCSSQDGALSWHTAINDYKNNPAPIYLMRFFFPEVKYFEIDEYKPGAAKRRDWRYWLWNGLGVYNSGGYPAKITDMLKRNADTFAYGRGEPMVKTLHPYIVANTFTAQDGKKRAWLLLCVAPNTLNGVQAIKLAPGSTCQAELSDNPISLNDDIVTMTLHPGEIAVVIETKK